MIDTIRSVIEEQERKIENFKKARSVELEHIEGTGKTTGLTIDVGETEAVYELQGMKKVLNRCQEVK